MNLSCPSASVARRIATLAFLALPVISASAAVIVQTVNDGVAAPDWNTRAIWGTPAAIPTAGNDYVTGTGFAAAGATNLGVSVTGRIRDNGTAAFAGSSLTIVSGSELLLKNLSTTSTANIILNGGVIRYAPTGGSAVTLAGSLNVAAESYLGTNNGAITTFTVSSTLTGSSILHIAAGAGDTSNLSSTISFTGDLSGFTGTFNVGGGTRTGGAKDATLDFGQDYFLPSVSLRMGEFASADFLNLDQDLTFGSFSFAATSLAAGTYTAAQLNTLTANSGRFLDGGGTLTVVPEPSAAALLAGAGCALVALTRRRQRATV